MNRLIRIASFLLFAFAVPLLVHLIDRDRAARDPVRESQRYGLIYGSKHRFAVRDGERCVQDISVLPGSMRGNAEEVAGYLAFITGGPGRLGIKCSEEVVVYLSDTSRPNVGVYWVDPTRPEDFAKTIAETDGREQKRQGTPRDAFVGRSTDEMKRTLL